MKNLKLTKAIRKSHRYNEDKIIIGGNYCIVCDGATPLYKSNIKPSEAAWFVTFIKNNMPKKCDNILNELNKVSKLAFSEYSKLNINSNKGELSYPSCGLSILEKKDNMVYIYTIGDCEALIRRNNGKLTRIVQPILSSFDKKALDLMVQTSKEKNISLKEAVKECNDILIKHRLLMNKPNGYPIYTISENPDFEYTVNFYDLDEINEIYLYTDGITQAFDELKIYNSCEEMFQNGIDLYNEIKKIETKAFSDKDCNKYPRFKTIDDIAIIKLSVN